MGDAPRWYRVLKAARYMGAAPWEVEEAPWRYVLQSEAAQAAEAHAASIQANRK